MTRFSSFLGALFASEADSQVLADCECGRLPRTSKCNECMQSDVLCDLCFVEWHRNNPTHWVEQWNSDFFEKMDQSRLGQVLSLGHLGYACPCAGDLSDPSRTTIFNLIDINGVHSMRVAFCRCPTAVDTVDQLLGAKIFPASVDRPTTGFTFNLLKTFHVDCLQSKKSAYDYVEALRRRTNGAFPSDVMVGHSHWICVRCSLHP